MSRVEEEGVEDAFLRLLQGLLLFLNITGLVATGAVAAATIFVIISLPPWWMLILNVGVGAWCAYLFCDFVGDIKENGWRGEKLAARVESVGRLTLGREGEEE